MGWQLLDAIARTIVLVAIVAGVAVAIVGFRVELGDIFRPDRDTVSDERR